MSPQDRPLRRDAQMRLDRLIEAAIDLYATAGPDVPLERIAERAGVSRPTLYRNFPDRNAISAMVLQVHLDDLTGRIAAIANRDDAFFEAIAILASKTVASGGLTKIVPMHRQSPHFGDRFRQGVEAALAGPLARAMTAGLVREDFTMADAHRAILMLAGGGLDDYGSNVASSIAKSLDLLKVGIAPPARPSAAGAPLRQSDQIAKL